MEKLLADFRAGDKVAAARIITMLEKGDPKGKEILKDLYKQCGRGYVIGLTGPAGAGKSTLTDALVKELRKKDYRVGVVAIDPTSPFTGGALLGDRIRMGDIAMDPGVFIRSMGTRGNLGGLSWEARDALTVLDAFGCDYLIVETVGAGQSQVEVEKVVDTVVMVTVPGLGDDIQANKAGIMEIGDLYVVNKADRGDADQVVRYLEASLELGHKTEGWQPRVCKTIAWKGEGVADVLDAITAHRSFLEETGKLEEMRKIRTYEEIIARARKMVIDELKEYKGINEIVERVYNRDQDPITAAEELVNSVVK